MARHDTLAARYARALAEYAVEQGEFALVRNELLLLRDWLDPDGADEVATAFVAALRSPVMDREARVGLSERVCAALGMSDTVIHFLSVMIRHGRMELTPAVLRAYDRLSHEIAGDHTVRVETARPLSSAQYQRLRHALSAAAGGAPVNLVVSVVPRLVAGVRLRLGDRRWDGSARGRLRRLADLLGANA